MNNTNECFAKQAHHGKPIPDGLPGKERPAYQMLCELYKMHRAGIMDKGTAAVLKKYLMCYPDCPIAERAALLRFFFLTEFERARSGNSESWEQALTLFNEYASLPLDKYQNFIKEIKNHE